MPAPCSSGASSPDVTVSLAHSHGITVATYALQFCWHSAFQWSFEAGVSSWGAEELDNWPELKRRVELGSGHRQSDSKTPAFSPGWSAPVGETEVAWGWSLRVQCNWCWKVRKCSGPYSQSRSLQLNLGKPQKDLILLWEDHGKEWLSAGHALKAHGLACAHKDVGLSQQILFKNHRTQCII